MTSWPGQPKAPPNPHRKFPPETCSACQYAKQNGDVLECWVNPPQTIMDEAELIPIRAQYTEPADPACHLFKHRQNA